MTINRSARADLIPGGLADTKNPADFNPDQLAKGIKVEHEHTSNPDIAREIAMDHLTEDPDYYDKLEIMEKSASPDQKKTLEKELVQLARSLADRGFHTQASQLDGIAMRIAEVQPKYQISVDYWPTATTQKEVKIIVYKLNGKTKQVVQNEVVVQGTDWADARAKAQPVVAAALAKFPQPGVQVNKIVHQQIHAQAGGDASQAPAALQPAKSKTPHAKPPAAPAKPAAPKWQDEEPGPVTTTPKWED